MDIDIVLVTYNSQKWIDRCIQSIAKSIYNLKQVSLYFVDNNSNDDTVSGLNKAKICYEGNFKNIEIIENSKNLGFGKGNNCGASRGKASFIFFLNIDTELDKYTLSKIEDYINNSEQDVAIFECRQFPYEHPKMYDPVTLVTTWSSGAAFVIRRSVFEELGGFDKNIFMYAEDVDLSWRVNVNNYKIKYIPKAIVHHYCYKEANEVKPNQYINSIINNIMLRYKFGNLNDVFNGYLMLVNLLRQKGPFEHSRKMLLKGFVTHFIKIFPYISWHFKNRNKLKTYKPKFLGWDYEIIRDGAFYINELPEINPKVSIIVRTCGRPDILRETLITLRNQTYDNLEVIIIEDGENISEEVIRKDFSDLNYVYTCTGEKVGRCKAGNIGLGKASGVYINFLDDDDVLFADHVEVLVKQLSKNSKYRAAYSLAFETPIIVQNRNPYKYREVFHNLIYRQPFNRIMLFHHNYIPIQAIMFEKGVYEEFGGFDENLDVLEDWDLWLRYALKNDYLYVNKVTSMYRVPFDRSVKQQRQEVLDQALTILRDKHNTYNSTVNVSITAAELQAILDSYIIKVSAEVFSQMKSQKPFISNLLIKIRNLAKKYMR